MELEKQIEELELKYLNKYYFFLKFTLDEILEGLKTRDNKRTDKFIVRRRNKRKDTK